MVDYFIPEGVSGKLLEKLAVGMQKEQDVCIHYHSYEEGCNWLKSKHQHSFRFQGRI